MKLFIGLVIVATLGFLTGFFFLTHANPEVSFWNSAYRMRITNLDERRAVRPEEPWILFAGGSSCAFSVESSVIKNITGWEAYNLGGPAGAGCKFLIGRVFEQAKSGDVVVLALERHFLTDEGRDRPTQLGLALAVAEGDLQAGAGAPVFTARITGRECVNHLRPGARFLATWMGKALKGNVSYRYDLDDVKSGGRLETNFIDPWKHSTGEMRKLSLTTEGRIFLQEAVDYGRRNQIRVVYSLPWLLTDEKWVAVNRTRNEMLLTEISEILPVLVDPNIGVISEDLFFSDSEYHLTEKGAHARSKMIAEGIVKLNLLKGH